MSSKKPIHSKSSSDSSDSLSQRRTIMKLRSQELRKIAPELDPLRLGTGWKLEDLSKPQIMIESTFGDSHPGSGHLL